MTLFWPCTMHLALTMATFGLCTFDLALAMVIFWIRTVNLALNMVSFWLAGKKQSQLSGHCPEANLRPPSIVCCLQHTRGSSLVHPLLPALGWAEQEPESWNCRGSVDLWRSFSPNSLLKQAPYSSCTGKHPGVFGYIQRRRCPHLSERSVPGLCHPQNSFSCSDGTFNHCSSASLQLQEAFICWISPQQSIQIAVIIWLFAPWW